MIHKIKRGFDLAGHKIRRLYHCNVYKHRTVKFIGKYRRGECNRCGHCCKILFHCPLYIEDVGDGLGGCSVYKDRPATCRMFPINARDLTNIPPGACGFYFVGDEE